MLGLYAGRFATPEELCAWGTPEGAPLQFVDVDDPSIAWLNDLDLMPLGIEHREEDDQHFIRCAEPTSIDGRAIVSFLWHEILPGCVIRVAQRVIRFCEPFQEAWFSTKNGTPLTEDMLRASGVTAWYITEGGCIAIRADVHISANDHEGNLFIALPDKYLALPRDRGDIRVQIREAVFYYNPE